MNKILEQIRKFFIDLKVDLIGSSKKQKFLYIICLAFAVYLVVSSKTVSEGIFCALLYVVCFILGRYFRTIQDRSKR